LLPAQPSDIYPPREQKLSRRAKNEAGHGSPKQHLDRGRPISASLGIKVTAKKKNLGTKSRRGRLQAIAKSDLAEI